MSCLCIWKTVNRCLRWHSILYLLGFDSHFKELTEKNQSILNRTFQSFSQFFTFVIYFRLKSHLFRDCCETNSLLFEIILKVFLPARNRSLMESNHFLSIFFMLNFLGILLFPLLLLILNIFHLIDFSLDTFLPLLISFIEIVIWCSFLFDTMYFLFLLFNFLDTLQK